MNEILRLAIRGTEIACGISLVIQTLEFMRLTQAMSDKGVWAFAIQGGDVSHASQPIQDFFAFMARETVAQAHLILRLIACVILIAFGSSLALLVFLFLGTILILARWRGAFNGGSDFMTIVVLTGLLIGSLGTALDNHEIAWQAGLMYIAIHSASSYFLSGGVKLFNGDWRSGKALPLFLDAGIYGPLPRDSMFWKHTVAIVCSWAFILWEITIPLAFIDPRLMVIYCGIGLMFHFLVFWFFGLNRFFFAWAATYPALLFAAIQLA